jgi:hypothetical protein
LIKIGKALAVYWALADNLWSAALVRPAASAMLKGERLPVELWVRVYLDQKATLSGATNAVATRGLADFIGREIETAYSKQTPKALIPLVLGTSHILIDRDLVLQDGETAGEEDSQQKFAIKLKDQGILEIGPVYALSAPR